MKSAKEMTMRILSFILLLSVLLAMSAAPAVPASAQDGGSRSSWSCWESSYADAPLRVCVSEESGRVFWQPWVALSLYSQIIGSTQYFLSPQFDIFLMTTSDGRVVEDINWGAYTDPNGWKKVPFPKIW